MHPVPKNSLLQIFADIVLCRKPCGPLFSECSPKIKLGCALTVLGSFTDVDEIDHLSGEPLTFSKIVKFSRTKIDHASSQLRYCEKMCDLLESKG